MNSILFTFVSSLLTAMFLLAGANVQPHNCIIHIDVKGNSTFSSQIYVSDNTGADLPNLAAKKYINRLKTKIAIKPKVLLLNIFHKLNYRDNLNKSANLRVSIFL